MLVVGVHAISCEGDVAPIWREYPCNMTVDTKDPSMQPSTAAENYPLKQPAGVDVSTFGSRVRQARDAARLTQEDLASKVNVDRATVGTWEAGVKPRPARIDALAKALNVTADWLQFGDAKPPSRNMGGLSELENEVEAHRRSLARQIRDLSLELDDTYR